MKVPSIVVTRRDKRRRQKMRSRLKKLGIMALVIAIIGTTSFIVVNHLFNKVKTEDTSPYLIPDTRPIKVQKNREIVYDKPIDRFDGALNILLIGSDTRGDNATSDDEGMRSDTTIIAHISADRKNVDMISIPRDSLVDIPACTLPDGTQTLPTRTKFNAAFSYGGQTNDVAAAAACTIKTVEGLTDVFIDGFAVIDFSGFEKVVNDLGGVEFDVKEEIVDPAFENLVIHAGVQTFDGKTALNYARVRKAIGMDGSDTARIGRQQELLSAIISKATAKMSDIPAMYKVVGSIADMTTVSSELASFSDLTGLAWALKDVDHENINFVTVPFIDAGDGSNVIWDSRSTELWEAIKNDTPITKEFISSIKEPLPVNETPDLYPCPSTTVGTRCPSFMS